MSQKERDSLEWLKRVVPEVGLVFRPGVEPA
jgi:hypothetical protein